MSIENTQEDNNPKTIDDAIDACLRVINWHRIISFIMLVMLVVITLAFYGSFKILEDLQNSANMNLLLNDNLQREAFLEKFTTYPYMIFALFLASFGITVGLYRFHINEIARNEQIKIGFWRIRVAARNTSIGFQTEVRQSLTKDAFVFNVKGQKEKVKEIESPIPGHPTSEFATTILNKILDSIDITVSKKDGK